MRSTQLSSLLEPTHASFARLVGPALSYVRDSAFQLRPLSERDVRKASTRDNARLCDCGLLDWVPTNPLRAIQLY